VKLPDDINPGIRRTVEWLIENGYSTTDSGDGATHAHACDRDHAYVVMVCHPSTLVEDAQWLGVLLGELGVQIEPVGGTGPCIQASYDPANRIGVIDLMNVTDALLWPKTDRP
jgi:hypothetical protein